MTTDIRVAKCCSSESRACISRDTKGYTTGSRACTGDTVLVLVTTTLAMHGLHVVVTIWQLLCYTCNIIFTDNDA